MKILILSLTLSTSVLSSTLTDFSSFFNLPEGLTIGKTLRTDLDPHLTTKDGAVYFANAYDAHFDGMGFLEKIVFDQDKKHQIPDTWGISWNANLDEVTSTLSTVGAIEVIKRDMSKSPFAASFHEVILQINNHNYHFQIVDWKEKSEQKNGLNRIVISAATI